MRRFFTVLALALSTQACTSTLGGQASFPLLSQATLSGYEHIASVDEQRCHQYLLLLEWGEDVSHEAVVSDLLVRHDGDAITNAELTIEWIDALFYIRECARVKGDVVRRTARGSDDKESKEGTNR